MDIQHQRQTESFQYDEIIIFVVFLLAVISIVAITSATRINELGQANYFYTRQIIYYVIGAAAAVFAARIDYHLVLKKWSWFYLFGIAMLVVIFLWGKVTHGANSWLKIGPFTFEPAEFMKLFLIFALAKWFAGDEPNQPRRDLLTIRDLAVPLGLSCLPCLLVLLQPDLGTTMMMSAITVGILFVAGIKPRPTVFLIGSASVLIGMLVLIYHHQPRLFFHIIQEYQWHRLTSFLHPEEQKDNYGYQVYQSMLAIGGGQVFGQGLFKGVQSQAGAVPERHTDFIFAVFSEETGFIGAASLLFLYGVLLYRMMRIASLAKDVEGLLVVTGVVSMFVAQIIENIGMTVSLMPITGITLPLISYGGSSILTSMLAIGLVLGIGGRSQRGWFS